ncbi:hypothetical protein M5D96_009950 [Drosophila gunungcola]|uniref:Uncharacterized protein n=1 Tax=Drosophila gunungcola TaxID=103775 RepID=A0A9P9YIH0_9MUSC|nr:hypothetical protein M5D96_009950 [Drosophila gunungcola]
MDIGTGTVRHLDVLRRPLLHSIHSAPGGHCGGQILDGDQYRLQQSADAAPRIPHDFLRLVCGPDCFLGAAIGWKDPDYMKRIEEQHCMVSQDVGYQIFATCCTFYVPLLVILFLYWKIYIIARKRIQRRAQKSFNVTLTETDPGHYDWEETEFSTSNYDNKSHAGTELTTVSSDADDYRTSNANEIITLSQQVAHATQHHLIASHLNAITPLAQSIAMGGAGCLATTSPSADGGGEGAEAGGACGAGTEGKQSGEERRSGPGRSSGQHRQSAPEAGQETTAPGGQEGEEGGPDSGHHHRGLRHLLAAVLRDGLTMSLCKECEIHTGGGIALPLAGLLQLDLESGHLHHLQSRISTGLQEDSVRSKGRGQSTQCENLISTEG